MSVPAPLVSTAWLNERLGQPRLTILDASWYLVQTGRDARSEYLQGHVPGALFFDLDALSDSRSPLPHMLPSETEFAAAIGGLGVGSEDTIVVYDGSGANLSAPRAWWTFRAFGHDRVAVLDGGLMKWRSEGRRLEAGDVRKPPAPFRARLREAWVWTLDQVRRNISIAAHQLVDARSAERFDGSVPEPRPGVRGGHVPGAVTLPYTSLVAADGTLLDPDRLRERFRAAGVNPAAPVTAMCGSGVTACAVLLALDVLGNRSTRLYDGSWTEWGSREDTPVA